MLSTDPRGRPSMKESSQSIMTGQISYPTRRMNASVSLAWCGRWNRVDAIALEPRTLNIPTVKRIRT